MTRWIVTATMLLLAGTASAQRTLELVENAIEASLADVRLPGGTAGTLRVKACDTCSTRSLRVDAGTRYLIGDMALTLADFEHEVERLAGAGRDQTTIVGVFYDRESGRVTRVVLFTS